MAMIKMKYVFLDGQPTDLTFVEFGECPECGDDCAEFWRDDDTGKQYVRCPYIMCDLWGKLNEVSE